MPGEPNVIRELVLAELRCACHRAKMAQMEIEFIGAALKSEMLSPEDALLALEGQGWQGFLDPILMSKLRAACCADA